MSLIVESIDRPCSDLLERVRNPLRAYNRAASPIFWSLFQDPRYDDRPLNLFAFLDGDAIGGLFAETRLAWLKISILSILPAHRKLGIGSRLMRSAECEAVRRGCRYALVDTMSYQAPEFYPKLGYACVGTLADWDSHGHDKFFFTKQLAP